jgi:hypothetical protein
LWLSPVLIIYSKAPTQEEFASVIEEVCLFASVIACFHQIRIMAGVDEKHFLP